MTWKHEDDKITRILKTAALQSEMVRSSRHAAAIVYKRRVLTIGRNGLKSHPIMLKWGRNEHSIYLHAEVDAINKYINQFGTQWLSKCSLYVLRINKQEEVASSCPCKGCRSLIDFHGIKKVFHT